MRKLIFLLFLPVTAQADSLYIDSIGNIGIGTNVPDKKVHVVGSVNGPEALYKLEQPEVKKVRFALRNPNGAWTFDISADASTFSITKVGDGSILKITDDGKMYLKGIQIH